MEWIELAKHVEFYEYDCKIWVEYKEELIHQLSQNQLFVQIEYGRMS